MFGRVNALNTGNRPKSGLSLGSKVKDRKAAYQYIMGPMAAKQAISV